MAATKDTTGEMPVVDGVITSKHGPYYNRIHTKTLELWTHLDTTGQIRHRLLDVSEFTDKHGVRRRVMTVAYRSKTEERAIWAIRRAIRDGLQEWLHDGATYPSVPNTPLFYDRYVQPRLGDTISSLAPRRRRPRVSHPSR